MTTRRSFLKTSATLAVATQIPLRLQANSSAEKARAAVEIANSEIWSRFVDDQDVLLDFTNLDGSVSLPTSEECRAGKPNALGWWTPTENGAMFNGLYLDGAINRALQTRNPIDKARAARLVDGLLRLASCSKVRGFIGRGFATDGKTTWPMGSNDQTGPWFYGLWRFLKSGLGDEVLRQRILGKFSEVAETLRLTDWRMPAEPPFDFRGSFSGFDWEGAPRLLFVCKAMHLLTDDATWDERYRIALEERPATGGLSRLQTCERGMMFHKKGDRPPSRHTWTGSCAAVSLRALWEMEDDESLRGAYANGLRATAVLAAKGMPYRKQFENDDTAHFERDWRKINELWKPQFNEEDAKALAQVQLSALNKLSPRRGAELRYVREAAFAAWVVTLCPDHGIVKQHEQEILATISYFNVKKLYFVTFFPLENAWWRLPASSA